MIADITNGYMMRMMITVTATRKRGDCISWKGTGTEVGTITNTLVSDQPKNAVKDLTDIMRNWDYENRTQQYGNKTSQQKL